MRTEEKTLSASGEALYEEVSGKFDSIDRKLLEILQKEFPLSASPWEEIGKMLHQSEEEILQRVRRLKERKLLRRIGAVLDAEKMQFVSCLCAMRVEPEKMEEVMAAINACSGVTHNYEREGTYNVWFTLTTAGTAARDRQLMLWEHQFGYPIFRFPSLKTYKRQVQFSVQWAGESV